MASGCNEGIGVAVDFLNKTRDAREKRLCATESSLGPDASRFCLASRNTADAGAASATAPAHILIAFVSRLCQFMTKGRQERMKSQCTWVMGQVKHELERSRHVITREVSLKRILRITVFSLMFGLCLAFVGASSSVAQSQAQNYESKQFAALNEPAQPAPSAAATSASASSNESSSRPASSSEAEIPAAVAKQLEEMEKRIEELEAALKARDAAAPPAAEPSAAPTPAVPASVTANPNQGQAPVVPAAAAAPASPTFDPQKQTLADPFSYADFTWMNGNSRNKDTPLATKYFTPEVRFDTNYMEDYNQPKDHTMAGATESFRSGEVQLEQMSFGGDIHVDNVRGRVQRCLDFLRQRHPATMAVRASASGT